jgi:hypothetical protein
MIEYKLTYRDYPFDAVVAKANLIIALGHAVHQKFSCANCGARLTIDTPNTFHETGTCDRCHAVTNIRARGCNYMVILGGAK